MSKDILTEEVVSIAVKSDKGEKSQLLSFEIKDFTKRGDNFLSNVTSIEAQILVDGNSVKESYIAKLNPFYSSKSLQNLIIDCFIKEGQFLQKTVPELSNILEEIGNTKLGIPECYYFSSKKDKEVIICEDLRKYGFKMIHRQQGFDKDHASLVLQELAKLHAVSIIQQKRTNTNLHNLYPFMKENWKNKNHANYEQYKKLYESYVQNAETLLTHVSGYETVTTWLESFQKRVMEECCQNCLNLAPDFDVICHGDCWSNNALFRYDSSSGKPIEVRLVDFQMVRVASLTTDLNYMLYSSLPGGERQNNLTNLLNLYLKTFNDVLQKGNISPKFSYEKLKEEYHSKNIWGLISGLMIVPMAVLDSEDSPDISNLTDDQFQKYYQEKKEKTINLLDSNVYFKPRFLTIFDEMIQYGIINIK